MLTAELNRNLKSPDPQQPSQAKRVHALRDGQRKRSFSACRLARLFPRAGQRCADPWESNAVRSRGVDRRVEARDDHVPRVKEDLPIRNQSCSISLWATYRFLLESIAAGPQEFQRGDLY